MNMQPNNLTNQELLRYAVVDNDKGLSGDWAQAVMQHFATMIDDLDGERTAHELTTNAKDGAEDELAEERREHNATKAALRELEDMLEKETEKLEKETEKLEEERTEHDATTLKLNRLL